MQLTVAGYEQGNTVLRIIVRDGRAGNIAAMLSGSGIAFKKLERTAIGPLELRGVARGHWRELERDEVRRLKKAAGLKNARTASASELRASPRAGHRNARAQEEVEL